MSVPTDLLPACAGCGLCCHFAVELRDGDVVPEVLVADRAGLRFMDQRANGACVALDPTSRLCSIYANRPQTCRDFGRGDPLCHAALQRFGTGRPAAAKGAPPWN